MAKPPAVQEPRKPIDTFKAHLTLAMPTLRHMIPQHVTPEKFQAMVVTAVAYDKNLLECATESLIRETAQAAELGLSLNKSLREADILAVWNGSGNPKQAQMRPRYMGLMKLARQSGEIADIYAHVVRDGDFFEWELGLNKDIKHRPGVKRGDVTHAYCVWVMKDGTKAFDEPMDIEDLHRIRDRSEGYKAFKAGKIKSTPWETDFDEMCRKTVVRRASKYMPISNEAFARAVAIDNRADASEDSKDDDVWHGSFTDVTDTGPAAPSPSARTQTDALADRVAPPARLEVPESLDSDGLDYATWAEEAVELLGKLAPAARPAWMKVHANILRDAPKDVVATVESAGR